MGPLAWAINTQLGEVLPYVECQSHLHYTTMASFVGVVLAGLTSILSWRSVNGRDFGSVEQATTLRFVGSVCGLAALLFAFALAIQGVASLVLTGCER